MFDALEEWEEFTDSFARVKLKDVRLLYSNLSDLLPHIEYLDGIRQKERKRNLVALLPRRTSDRIATKAAEKEEIVSISLKVQCRECLLYWSFRWSIKLSLVVSKKCGWIKCM